MFKGPSLTAWAQPIESRIADKFAAIITLGMTNTRLKDFRDLLMFRRQDSDLSAVAGARQPEPAAIAVPDAAPAPAAKPVWLTDYLTVRKAETHADLKLKEAVHAAMQRIVDMCRSFVAEKTNEGFSPDEVLALYEVTGPVVPTVVELPDGRLKVKWDVGIVEKGTEE